MTKVDQKLFKEFLIYIMLFESYYGNTSYLVVVKGLPGPVSLIEVLRSTFTDIMT